MKQLFSGIGVALVTPFTTDNKIDYTALKKIIQHVVDGGADYLAVNGTTGEASTLSENEKRELLAFVHRQKPSDIPILFGIGANNTQHVLDTIDTTDMSLVDGILTVCPYYNKPTQEGVYQHYKTIAKHTKKPIILYNVPGRAAINMTAETVIRLSKIENIIGVKDASGDLEQAMKITKYTSKSFLLISGDDILTIPMITVGAKGAISVLANAIPEQFCDMVNQGLEQDFSEAQEILLSILELNDLMYAENSPVGVKTLMHELKLCDTNVRLPLVKASEKLVSDIQEQVSILSLS
ncbi:MAG: 4-hydroxy-tetrahydrodipicolinate synthase [Cyclobacteriaceae bacterium]